MKKLKRVANTSLIMLMCLAPLNLNAGQISMIGLDSEGKETETSIEAPLFKHQLAKVTATYHDSTMKALSNFGVNGDWRFSTVMVGAEVLGEMGFGDILKGSAGAKLEFYFTR